MERSVLKWLRCKNSLTFGFFAGDEAGYALADEGYNENYGCEKEEIVQSGQFQKIRIGRSKVVAKLHGLGRDKDQSVIDTLESTCGQCPYFNK